MAVLNSSRAPLVRAAALALICAVTLVAAACAPPPELVTRVVRVAGDEPSWQSQPENAGPGGAIHVKEGDGVALSIFGSVVYKTELGGLRKLDSDGWAVAGESRCDRYPAQDAAVGVLLCRIGSDGPILTVSRENPAFPADREGALQFLVNDRREAYGDNTGAFRVAVTVVRR